MKRDTMRMLIILFIVLITVSSLPAQRKLAQTGFQFLSVGSDARAGAMGEAFTTIEGTSSALFYNPAGLARLTTFMDASASYNSWMADIKYNAFSLAINPRHGQYGVLGVSAVWVDYGEFLGTMVWDNAQGYIDTEIFSPKAIALGIGYAKLLNDRFAVGGQVKYVSQTLGENVLPDDNSSTGLGMKRNVTSVTAFDFGTVFHTGYKSLNFGMNVRNFSQELKFEEEGFQLPLTFKIGISMNLIDFLPQYEKTHSLLLAIDAVHPRSFQEYLNLGAEYEFMNMLALSAGYITSQDEYGLTYGFGVKLYGLEFHYAYTPFDSFDKVQRITVQFSK